MKCRFAMNVDVDVSALPDSEKSKVRWKMETNKVTGRVRGQAYFPADTVYEHENAQFFVNHGMAFPEDDECKAASTSMSDADRQKLIQGYKATALGIEDPNDRELFFAGVIAGYQKLAGQIVYVPGPNYAAWKATIDEAAKQTQESTPVPI